MTDVQRWFFGHESPSSVDDGTEPWVLAVEAEAHERAALKVQHAAMMRVVEDGWDELERATVEDCIEALGDLGVLTEFHGWSPERLLVEVVGRLRGLQPPVG